MGGTQRDTKHSPATTRKPASTEESHSPRTGGATADGGYAEQHGPRVDADGWGEANPSRDADADAQSQGQQTGERSFDHGPEDPAAEQAASDAALREPGERGADDAKPSPEASGEETPPEDIEQPPSVDGRQIDYGQGGGQGYVHTGKPGAPGPDGKTD